ncbi:MAG: hypothetical protein P9C48_13330 [Defluviicoccus sp.]|nr:hypothetical protein [Defluviicoccus sp.]MDG4610102.1 hypothetical protein [Defluviicoccus sp.]
MTQTGLFWVEKLYRQARTEVSRGTILVPRRHSPASCSTALFAGHTAGKEAEHIIEGDAKAGAAAASSNKIEATAGDQFEHLGATRQPIQMMTNQSNREKETKMTRHGVIKNAQERPGLHVRH